MNLSAVFYLPHQLPLPAFYEVQKKVYGNNCLPDAINHPYLVTSLIVYNEDEPLGRICMYLNPAISGKKTLLFGNIECINDTLVFEKLIEEVEHYTVANGYDTLLGPINGTTWDEYRLPLTNEGCQFINDLPQPLYYADFLMQNGFEIVQQYYTQQSTLTHQKIDEVLEQIFLQQGISIRSINLNHFENELEKLYPFCIEAFAQNTYYSVIDKADFIAKYKKVQPFLKADFILIAADAQQQIVAFLLCLQDVYQPNTIVMKTMARSRQPQLRGLMTHMINIFYNRAVAAGYIHLIHAFYHETNRSALLSEKYNGQPLKVYGLFQKKTVL